MHRVLLVLAMQGVCTSGLDAGERIQADWPRFQGPTGQGSSPETGLLRAWPDGGPEVLWRVPVKPGWSSPTAAGDSIYVCATESQRGDTESVVCLNALNGTERWRFEYHVGPYWERNIGWGRGGFRATPCLAGDWLFSLGAVGHLHCLNRHTGAVVWKQNLWDEWNPSGEKGYVFSPIVEDGKLILWYGDGVSDAHAEFPDPETERDKRLVLCRALDVETGKLLWEYREQHIGSARCGEGQTPAVAEFGGDKCLLVTANCDLKALRIADGKEVWKLRCIKLDARGTTIPTPLVHEKYIVNLPDNDEAHVVEFDRNRLQSEPKFAWKKNLDTYCAIHQFRLHGGYLYGFTGEIRGGDESAASESMLNLSCLELATGKLMWSQSGFRNGVSLTEADGLLFVRSYQTLRLVEARPDRYQPVGKVRTHEETRPTLNLLDLVQPVLCRGRLLIRTPKELIVYRVSE